MDIMLSDCSNAANEMSRNGGFAPALWVLGCLPRAPPTMDDEENVLSTTDRGLESGSAIGSTTATDLEGGPHPVVTGSAPVQGDCTWTESLLQ